MVEETWSRLPAFGLAALLVAAGLMLGGGGRRVVSLSAAAVAAPVAAPGVWAAPAAGAVRVAGPSLAAGVVPTAAISSPAGAPGGARESAVPAAAAAAGARPETAAAVAAAIPAAVPRPYYGGVSVHTGAGRRYMAVVADPLAGLGPLPAGWTAQAHTVDVAGLTRTYITVAPATLTGSVPVVVLLHGVAMTAAQILNLTHLAAQTGPAVIVAPQGWEQSWDADGCCGAAFHAGIDDVDFIST